MHQPNPFIRRPGWLPSQIQQVCVIPFKGGHLLGLNWSQSWTTRLIRKSIFWWRKRKDNNLGDFFHPRKTQQQGDNVQERKKCCTTQRAKDNGRVLFCSPTQPKKSHKLATSCGRKIADIPYAMGKHHKAVYLELCHPRLQNRIYRSPSARYFLRSIKSLIQELVHQRVVIPVPTEEEHLGFYPYVFLVEWPLRKFHLILNL